MRHCIACLSTVASVHCSRSVCRGAHLAPDCGGIGGTCRKKTLSRMVSAYYAPPKVTSNKYKLFLYGIPAVGLLDRGGDSSFSEISVNHSCPSSFLLLADLRPPMPRCLKHCAFVIFPDFITSLVGWSVIIDYQLVISLFQQLMVTQLRIWNDIPP